MNRILIKNGPVAYFDILGYKSIIDNNEIETVAQLIVDHLDKTPAYLHDYIMNSFSSFGLSEKDLDRLAKLTYRLLLSDSVLLTAKHPRGKFDPEDRLWEWLIFVLECRQLMGKMFENGLPLKGAIGYGEYFRKGNCFAGKPIVDAFRLAQNLDIAGCAFVPKTWNEIEKALAKCNEQIAEFIRKLSFKYEVNLKSGKSKSLMMVVFTPPNSEGSIREKVHKAFTAYKKEITGEVETKFENTVLMIESFVNANNIHPENKALNY